MKYLVMVYCEGSLPGARPEGEFGSRMCGRLNKAATLRVQAQLLDSQQLDAASTARTVRVREGRASVVDAPFAETKGHLVGTRLIEAADVEEAVLVASSFPAARTGAIEIRRVRNVKLMRQRAGA